MAHSGDQALGSFSSESGATDNWLIMADTPQSIECSSAELSHLLSNYFVSESEAILKMAENLKSILRAQK
jgi:hypothetical protein